jgi:hypothetical protein
MELHAIIKAGTNGEDYRASFKAIGATTGEIVVQQLEVRVRSELTGSL